MVADLLTEGAGDLQERAFKDKLSELGTRLTAQGGRDAMYLGLESLSKRFAPSAGAKIRPGQAVITVTVTVRPGEEGAPPRNPVITAEPQPVETTGD